MVKQFDSMYVADSVAVMNLKGELLGYVPRRHISRFPHDTNFGHVYAINQDAASLWRLTVSSVPVLALSIPMAHVSQVNTATCACFIQGLLHAVCNVKSFRVSWVCVLMGAV